MLQKNTVLLDRYRVLSVAGEGGMGRVYHTVDIHDGTHWAIKENLARDMDDQLYEEAEVLRGLDHPALPRTRGVRVSGGSCYMIMQFMEGDTLSHMLKTQNKYPETQVLDWFRQICDVLCYLHSRPHPIVYRDLKPSNIIVDGEGKIRIIDFGIAEEYASQEGDLQLHKGGLTKGYAAPEQYSRRFRADVRTDIYALGVTVHYLLTGKNPIKPPYEFLPVRKLAPEVSPAMEEIVKRCLRPNPDQRYPSADVLMAELNSIDSRNRVLKNRKRLRLAGFLLAVLVAAAGLVGMQGVIRQQRQKEIAAYYTLVEESRQMADSGDFSGAAELAAQAVQTLPDELAGYLSQGYVILRQGDFDGCLRYISTEVLDRFPDCYTDTQFLGLMGQLYMENGKNEDALYYYQERCNLSGETPEYWLELAKCYLTLGQNAEAEAAAERFLEAGGSEVLYQEFLAALE